MAVALQKFLLSAGATIQVPFFPRAVTWPTCRLRISSASFGPSFARNGVRRPLTPCPTPSSSYAYHQDQPQLVHILNGHPSVLQQGHYTKLVLSVISLSPHVTLFLASSPHWSRGKCITLLLVAAKISTTSLHHNIPCSQVPSLIQHLSLITSN